MCTTAYTREFNCQRQMNCVRSCILTFCQTSASRDGKFSFGLIRAPVFAGKMFRSVLHTARTVILPNLLSTENVVVQQTRNTFILKRRWEPYLHKKGQKPRILKSRQFIYDLVEDTSIKRKPDMEVILTAFVDSIGNKGDIVSVRPNFAYNKLLLPGLAVYKTPENIAKYKSDEMNKTEKLHSSPFAQRTVNVLESRVVAVVMNKFQPWVVQPWHIVASLRKCGVYVMDESCIEMPKEPITGPDLVKNNKEFIVTVTINNLEKAKVRCRIFHWSNDPKTREPYVFEHWKQPAELLFPNDETQWLPPMKDEAAITPPSNA